LNIFTCLEQGIRRLLMADAIGIIALLVGLEIVLGVDNILVISIFVARLPENRRQKARAVGLSMAMAARIVMLAVVLTLATLTQPIVSGLSVRDLILLAGGLFLLFKAVHEIHNTVEFRGAEHAHGGKTAGAFASAITQIVLLDIVFSIDSVITAVGLTREFWIIVTAVVFSFIGLMFFARPVGEFILRHPALKILALSFLITIGVTIFMEGLHQHVPKGYIYLPMGFALVVELLQMRYAHNLGRRNS
jgi:predicted tellurium resistance membrane protein TerC